MKSDHGVTTVGKNGVQDTWGRSLFDEEYKNQIRKLLRAISNVVSATVQFSIDGSPEVCFPAGGTNSFCKLLSSTQWGKSKCRDEEIVANQASDKLHGRLQRHVCWMGFENLSYVFRVIGLGQICISMGRVPPPQQEALSRKSLISSLKDLATINKEGPVTTRNLVGLHNAAFDELSHLSSNSVSLFVQCCRVIQEILKSGMETSLLARSYIHELSISLTASANSAEYLSFKVGSTEDSISNDDLQGILDHHALAIDQLLLARHLANNLLQFYSWRSRKEPLTFRRESIDLNREIEVAADLWERTARHRDIRIEIEHRFAATVSGDNRQLRQVFHNLLSNATKYSYATSDRGNERFIEIEIMQYDPGFREERVIVKITNYGVGILPDEKPLLGRPGFRGSLAEKEHMVGLGMGLYICREIVHLHGGMLNIDSSYLHKSTRVWRGQELESETYLTTASLILPTSNS